MFTDFLLSNRSRVNEELSKVVGLIIKERHKATKLIVCQHELIDVFFSVPDEEKEEWVKGIINGDFGVFDKLDYVIFNHVFFFFI